MRDTGCTGRPSSHSLPPTWQAKVRESKREPTLSTSTACGLPPADSGQPSLFLPDASRKRSTNTGRTRSNRSPVPSAVPVTLTSRSHSCGSTQKNRPAPLFLPEPPGSFRKPFAFRKNKRTQHPPCRPQNRNRSQRKNRDYSFA